MTLEVFSDFSERLRYNLPGFPLYVRRGELRHFDHFKTACHWHPDLEFTLVLDGVKDYFINGKTLRLEKGEGIFVNSKRLHYGFSADKSNCSYIVIVVHPSLLGDGTFPGKEFIESKFSSATEDYIVLTDKSDWQRDVLKSMTLIYDEMYSDARNPLRLISQIISLCASIGDNIQAASMKHSDERSWLAVWNMTGYIQKNYFKKLTLDDIAASGSVCRSKCCILFKEFVGQTPNAYLIRYRVQKSCEMLLESNMSVIEISMASGFQRPSYFSHIFQKETGLTPKEYRNKPVLDHAAPPR